MASYSFGRKQIGKPTPASISFKITVISVVCPVIQIWLGTASYIPNVWSNILVSILGLFIALSNALKPLFGVSVEESSVPTEEVKEIEDKKEP